MRPELRAWLADAWRALWPPRFLQDPALAEYFGAYRPTSSGESVTEYTALNCAAVWACVQAISRDVASLPFFHYRVLPNGGKERYTTSRLYRILHDEFNPEMSAMSARQMMQAHVLLWGNAYAMIVRNDLGQIVALWPLEPPRVSPRRDRPNGPVVYHVVNVDGQEVPLPAAQILHIHGLGYDGLMGYSVVAKARESFGLQIAAERLGGSFFASGAKHSGFFQHPKVLGATAHAHLKESIRADQPGEFRILEEGMTFVPGSMHMQDAQFLETRKFQLEEICRWFDVPPDRIHDLTHGTFSNIEQQAINYVVRSLRPWLVLWEAECNRKLIPSLEYGNQKCEHLVDALLRGDAVTRSTALQVQFMNGALSINEWREIENRNPIEGDAGNQHFVALNLVPVERVNEVIDKQVEEDPTPATGLPGPDATLRTRLLAHLVGDVATRGLRRELEGVRKIAREHATDGAAWRQEIEEFYARHTAYLAEVLHIPLDRVRPYTEDHRALLLAHGLTAAEQWNGDATADLIALVQED